MANDVFADLGLKVEALTPLNFSGTCVEDREFVDFDGASSVMRHLHRTLLI